MSCGGSSMDTPEESLRVLFIGNSHTYVNDLPALVAQMAQATGSTLEYQTIARPNFGLMDHWAVGEAQEAIRTYFADMSARIHWVEDARAAAEPNQLAALVDFAQRAWFDGIGAVGTVLATEDGGATWVPQETQGSVTLFDVYFSDPLTGWVVGNAGAMFQTTDGGGRWIDRTLPCSRTCTSGWPTPPPDAASPCSTSAPCMRLPRAPSARRCGATSCTPTRSGTASPPSRSTAGCVGTRVSHLPASTARPRSPTRRTPRSSARSSQCSRPRSSRREQRDDPALPSPDDALRSSATAFFLIGRFVSQVSRDPIDTNAVVGDR